MKILNLTLAMTLIFCGVCLGQVAYFDKNGNRITADEYQLLKKITVKQAAEAPTINRISHPPAPQPAAIPAEDEMPVDFLGRPLKDDQGRWITYPETETGGRGYTTRSNSYVSGEDSPYGDMDAARRADRYKRKYLRDGKTTDLIRYRRELDKAFK